MNMKINVIQKKQLENIIDHQINKGFRLEKTGKHKKGKK